MLNFDKCVKQDNLISKGDIIGVACSGGEDSMCLLHYLNNNKKKFGCEVVVINVDHNLRSTSKKDSEFVINYCKNNKISCEHTSLDIKKICSSKKLTVEEGAREGRYDFFKSLIKKGIVTKIALGHHVSDQAETILLNLFRGSGLTGARGMDTLRDNIFIRPLLTTSKADIKKYIQENKIPYVIDETNAEIEASRNYLRNMIMPMVRNRWPSFENSLENFSKACKIDDEYINNTISKNAVVVESEGTCKISLTYISYPLPVIYRILRKAFKTIGVFSDIESKHLNIIISLGLEAENGSKINLPHQVTVLKEYGYLTITNKNYTPEPIKIPIKAGVTDIPKFGIIEMVRTRNLDMNKFNHVIDYKSVPKSAYWRFRQDGDVFEKFGGGTKSLSDYFINKKVPSRLRGIVPLLAYKNEILVIAGIEISNKVKIIPETKTAWGINVVRF